MAIMVILSMALNSYWFILMVKMIVRVIKRALAPKQEDNIEKIELIKADSLADREKQEQECVRSTQGSNAAEGIEEE